MTRLRQIKTTFTSGEISRRLLGRGDLAAYENGALSLRNVFIHPTGGITRRSGLAYIDTVPGNGRLIDFEFNTDQTYLLVLTDLQMDIYQDGVKIETIVTPWSEPHLTQINWTQSADTLLICHPDIQPQKLTRSGAGAWSLSPWVFHTDDNGVNRQPMFKHAESSVTLNPSGSSGTITITASTNIFNPLHAGNFLSIGGKQVEITSYASPTVVDALVIENLDNTNATTDWEEQAFSMLRGWPISVCFHQDRLVIGGSRDLPNRLWMSKSGDIWNFDLGEGLDDESIEFSILSDQVNAIRAVFSGRDLQVFTSGAEWQVVGSPLTPATVQIDRQTRIGSLTDRVVAPVDIDGATMFVARNGREIREFLYTDLEAAYQSTDVSLLARHLIDQPIDSAFDQRNRLLHFVLENGDMATLTNYRTEKVSAWTLQQTAGQFLSVTVTGDDVYVLVHRNGIYTIELYDSDLYQDSTLEGSAQTPTSTWSGLNHLEEQSVTIIADDIVRPNKVVSNGSITLDAPASDVKIGLSFTHIIEPLPPSTLSVNGAGRAVKMIESVFRVEDTSALRLDVGRGLDDIPLRDFDDGQILDAPIEMVSRDITVKAMGWAKDLTKSLWRIEQNAPLPFTLLSVTTELKVND
jgi:hypothetical protein